jgi:hypothetical protein
MGELDRENDRSMRADQVTGISSRQGWQAELRGVHLDGCEYGYHQVSIHKNVIKWSAHELKIISLSQANDARRPLLGF